MVSRIKQLLDWQQLSPTQFADRIGVGRPVVSHILSERNKPSLDVVRQIRAAFPMISLDWLLDGTGPMLSEPVAAAAAPPPLQAPAEVLAAPAAVLLAASPQSVSAPANSGFPAPELLAGSAAAPVAAATVPVATVAAPLPQPSPRPAIPRFQPGVAATAAVSRPLANATAAGPLAAEVLPPPAGAAGPVTPAPVGQVVAAAATTPVAPPAVAAAPLVAEAPTAAPAYPPAPAAAPAPPVVEVLPAPAPVPVEVAPAVPPQVSAPGLPTLADVFGESGKAIRRIVIFYRDGSFADYQPES